jgi:hypothetical protein
MNSLCFKKNILLNLILCLFYSSTNASEFLIEDLNRDKNKQQTWVVLPYIFSSESMGFTIGAVGILAGYIQPQMTIIATTFIGEELAIKHSDLRESDTERTSGAMLAINGYRPSFSNRLFVSAIGAYGYYPNQRLYLEGGNDSKKT